MRPERNFTLLLEEIATSEPHIRMVGLTSRAGVLKGVIKQATSTTPIPKIDELHAFLGSAIAQAYVQIGSIYEFNDLYTVIIEYHQGTLLLAPTGTGVLIVLADLGANIGYIKYQMKTVAKKFHTLENDLGTHKVPSFIEIPDDFGMKQPRISSDSDEHPSEEEKRTRKKKKHKTGP